MSMLRHLLTDRSGTMAVETAIVAPVLILLGIGSFQVGDMVSRQHALQAAAAEAEHIALASRPETQARLDTIESILSASHGIAPSNVTLTFTYRCGTAVNRVADPSTCGADPPWTFVDIVLSETYSPPWTQLGVGSDVPLRVARTVQIS